MRNPLKERAFKKREKRIRRPFDEPGDGYTADLGSLSTDKAVKSSMLFQKLPVEIRNNLLRLAFGDRTLHMDRGLRYPVKWWLKGKKWKRTTCQTATYKRTQLLQGAKLGVAWFNVSLRFVPALVMARARRTGPSGL